MIGKSIDSVISVNSMETVSTVNHDLRPRYPLTRSSQIDMEKIFQCMESGNKVCKMALLKKWDPLFRQLTYNRETRQLILSKVDGTKGVKSNFLDLRSLKEVHTLDFKLNTMLINDKWTKDKEIRQFDATKIIVLSFGYEFVLNQWILLFETRDICGLWYQGVHYLMMDTVSASHTLLVERWIRKEFYNLAGLGSDRIERKQMKPFIQTSLQYKIQAMALQELTEEEMNFDMFASAYRTMLFSNELFSDRFSIYSDDTMKVSFDNYFRFLRKNQREEIGNRRDCAGEFLRRFLKDFDPSRNVPEPFLNTAEFCDILFSRENCIWDPINEQVVHDMHQPLSHYWIASSHNTYLTGDQLKSESSLDAYARALLMGCRCIELDCWDGPRRGPDDLPEIVIYHGYTMTSKLNLRDVLYTIRHYAFINSDYPVILSIEDNCSVPAQRLLAHELKSVFGDFLLTAPVNRDEHELPSPAALRGKIILKHKKLPTESEDIIVQHVDDDQDQDLLSRNCVKRGLLHLRNAGTNEWTKHIFVLFTNRLCYTMEDCEIANGNAKTDAGSQEIADDIPNFGFGVQPHEMHVTEEWFHGKINRDAACFRLNESRSKGNGLFLVRDSGVFIGDYSLSFLYSDKVYHCRIRTRMINGQKKYYFLNDKFMDTLYELVSYYTQERLVTPNFSTKLITACPQPAPHLTMPWFAGEMSKERADQLLSMLNRNGAFLFRHSLSDKDIFVLSLRANESNWHYRLKRIGRIFVVNEMVFDSINQIVAFYSSHELIWGTCLKIPVSETLEYVNDETEIVSGLYFDLKDLDGKMFVRAVKANRAVSPSELSFPINSVITVWKKNGTRYWGKYGTNSGFFPSECVVELNSENISEVSYSTIELAGSIIEKVDVDRPFGFRISQASSHWNVTEHVLAANSSEDLEDWLNTLHELTRTATDRIHILRLREKDLCVASELSNLVVYCQAVPFNAHIATHGNFYEMCSFSETKLDKLFEKGLVRFNTRQLSRVYPQGSRIKSTNYDPIAAWNCGCHMVALNYQTGDRSMQLNQGKFVANGLCGYILKPSYLMEESFSPNASELVTTSCPVSLTVEVIAGRHLSRKDKSKGICSPFVEVEIIGLPADCKVSRTRPIASNGFNPMWNETFTFNIFCPEMCLLRFYVEDADFVGPKSDPFIGQAVYSVDCLRSGYRSVILCNQFSVELELSALLLHVAMRRLNSDGEYLNIHSSLQAGRSTIGNSKILTTTSYTSGLFHARLNSVDQKQFTPRSAENSSQSSMDRSSFDSVSSSTPLTVKSKKSFKKLFKFGHKTAQSQP